jgi:creatinine amidohydrolase/Fe(II)-dependent formamide hydrolase-like protein
VPGFRTVDMFKVPPFFMINEFDELSENGVIGMPDFATAEKGEKFLEAAVNGVVRFIDEFATWKFQKKFTLEGRI